MPTLNQLYSQNLALLTDMYELTMAHGYWHLGMHDHEAAFHVIFRNTPFDSGYAVTAGLAYAIDHVRSFHFTDDDIDYLHKQTGNDDKPLFADGFLDYLREMTVTCDIDAMPEGTVCFAHEPMMRVTGPLLEAQILETALLNCLNFQTLVATKASRICGAAQGEPVLEFGLRRAQGLDGGIAASRAAFVGGCAATSNVLAGKLFDIPASGTQAHSWVMSFDDELESFMAWARTQPNNVVLLVDTYDSLEGVRKAVEVGHKLRQWGHELIGIRLDSGDLAYLSIEARKILDDAGFEQAKIFGSNDLDEHIIESLKQQGCKITMWGVGTRLATAYDEPALGGVYKLAAIRRQDEPWSRRVKLSEQSAKISTPGLLQVRRYSEDNRYLADMVYDIEMGIAEKPIIVDLEDVTRRKTIPASAQGEDLLVPVFRKGDLVYDTPPLSDSRQRALDQVARLHPGIRRLVNPHEYPAGLEQDLHKLRTKLIMEARGLELES